MRNEWRGATGTSNVPNFGYTRCKAESANFFSLTSQLGYISHLPRPLCSQVHQPIPSSMAKNEEFSQMWAEGFSTYEKETGRDLKLNPALRSLRTTDDLLAQIAKASESQGTFRSKHSRLWSRLRASVKPLELFGAVAKAAIGLSPFAPATSCWTLLYSWSGLPKA